jgi:hypothetical protein
MTALQAFKRNQVQFGLPRRNVMHLHFTLASRTDKDRLNVVRPIERVVHGPHLSSEYKYPFYFSRVQQANTHKEISSTRSLTRTEALGLPLPRYRGDLPGYREGVLPYEWIFDANQ